MSDNLEQQTPPGWYIDPAGSGGWRYFDGTAWTQNVQQRAKNVEAPALRRKVAPLAGRLVQYFFPASLLLGVTSLVMMYLSRDLFHLGHSIIEWIKQGDANAPLPKIASSRSAFEVTVSRLTSAAKLGVLVMFLIWQFRSHTEALAFGYPKRISRTFAMWSWFLPIVSFVVPYLALSQLLPPDHKDRRFVWYLCAVNGCRLLTTMLVFVSIWTGELAWWNVWFVVSLVAAIGSPLLHRQIIIATEANHSAFADLVS